MSTTIATAVQARFHELPIAALVPHRQEMSFLQRLLHWDGDTVITELQVPYSGLFVEGGGVPAWIGIEYMAQTIAAWAGCRERAAGRPPGIGFLLGSRRYSASRSLFASGSILQVHARCELLGDNGLGMFACRITAGDEEWAIANVSVYQPEDAVAYLESGQA